MEKSKLHTKIKTDNYYAAILLFAFCILNLFGCASLKEATRGFWGTSTKALEETRKDAAKENFKADFNTCYNKTLEILAQIKAYIYSKDLKNNLIAIYVSEEDTTPVGIFFTAIDASNTQIEVSSPSLYAKEFIAAKLFPELVMAINPVKEEKKQEQ